MCADRSGPDDDAVLSELAALRRIARALTGRQDEADDLVQAVFERVLPRWHRIDGDPRGYLTKVLVNLHRDQVRRSRREMALPRHVQQTHGQNLDGADDRMDFDRLLAGLPVRARAIVVLRYLDDLPAAQVGRIVGLPASSVRRIAAAALATLRPMLATPEASPATEESP